MKNSIGIIIIVGVLAVTTMKAFNIEFNINNLKIVGLVSIGIFISILALLNMQSKKSPNSNNYFKPEIDEENPYESKDNEEDLTLQTNNYQDNQLIKQQEEENYDNYQKNNNTQVQPVPYNSGYITPTEEDNRWS